MNAPKSKALLGFPSPQFNIYQIRCLSIIGFFVVVFIFLVVHKLTMPLATDDRVEVSKGAA